jgi:uncharacterized membrane protein HdeD (DUF308 family)
MSLSMPDEYPRSRRILRHELEVLRGEWPWFLILGILLIVIGIIAIGAPFAAGLTTAVIFGVLLLAGGVVQFVGSFWARDWSGFFVTLISGVLYVVVGLLSVRHPANALAALTLLLACGLLVEGLFRVVGSLMYQFPQWGWALAGGLIDVVLGLIIWMEWPLATLWVIGLFVGISMIYNGWTWVLLGLALKNRSGRLGDTTAPTPTV